MQLTATVQRSRGPDCCGTDQLFRDLVHSSCDIECPPASLRSFLPVVTRKLQNFSPFEKMTPVQLPRLSWEAVLLPPGAQGHSSRPWNLALEQIGDCLIWGCLKLGAHPKPSFSLQETSHLHRFTIWDPHRLELSNGPFWSNGRHRIHVTASTASPARRPSGQRKWWQRRLPNASRCSGCQSLGFQMCLNVLRMCVWFSILLILLKWTTI